MDEAAGGSWEKRMVLGRDRAVSTHLSVAILLRIRAQSPPKTWGTLTGVTRAPFDTQ